MADQDQSQVISDTIPLSALVSQINSSQVSAQRTADRYARSGALDVCRFDDGYQTQLVFACQTCRTSVSHGFCLACSMHCHLDHDVVETGRKRHFRCDCGTERLPRPCQLTKKPEGTNNQENRYNQNFMGLFCHCSKPYDPDTESKDVIMCCRCEDWFHDDLNCIGEAAGQKQSQGLYVCANCVQQAPLLASYCNAASSTESTDSWETSCSKPPSVTPGQHGIYLSSDITSRICRCDECLRVIADEKIEFLVEDESPDDDGEDDDDECPEQELKPEFNSEYILERALSRLPREMAIEGALRFRKFTDSIILGLKQITANDKDKIITADDVNAICESVLGKRSRGDDDS